MLKLFAIIFTIQSVFGGSRYPSGMNPALCPNYPHCDNALLAAYVQPATYQDHYTQNYDEIPHPKNAANYHQQPVVPLPYVEPGYPAGLSSSSCPNYPYCSHHIPAEALKYNNQNRYQQVPAYNYY
ncbi:cuticle protein 1 [Daktulosphaira vitifoliae]|uniref:cuticle protein 1 n=1 Tax=Daktulosphaira vitifoliae TaxID=58002 RepID=UPI0021AA4473|nr:cuticle protein 1 [Daktulosphaira vitifoliae]